MKRFLFAGEGCVCRVYGKIFLLIFLLFFVINSGFAQQLINKDKYPIPKGGVTLGQKVPEWFWDLSFENINPLFFRKNIHLKDYRTKILVIDFWATWCAPCVESVVKWDTLSRDFPNEVGVIALHSFESKAKAKPFIENRNWKLPVATGPADSIINRLFFTHYRYGQIWIKDDKLIAVPLSNSINRENIIRVIKNLNSELVNDSVLTYFDPRYNINQEIHENNN